MVHTHQGQPQGQGQALGVADPHQQGAHQPGAAGDRQGVALGKGYLRPAQGLLHHGADPLHMAAGSQLRHHPAVLPVEGDLGMDRHGQHPPPALQHRGGGFVAGAFYGQQQRFGVLPISGQPCRRLFFIGNQAAAPSFPARRPTRPTTRLTTASPTRDRPVKAAMIPENSSRGQMRIILQVA